MKKDSIQVTFYSVIRAISNSNDDFYNKLVGVLCFKIIVLITGAYWSSFLTLIFIIF